jgi:hypothetical protein
MTRAYALVIVGFGCGRRVPVYPLVPVKTACVPLLLAREWHGERPGESLGTLVRVSQVEPVTVEEALAKLSADDRAWLEQFLVEYRDLLDYLADH